MVAILDESFNVARMDTPYKNDYLNSLMCAFSYESYQIMRRDHSVDNGTYFRLLHLRVPPLLIFESWQFLNQ